MLYRFLEGRIWSKRLERLGFDEVFLDVTDMIRYNMDILNPYDLAHSFFHTSRMDPTSGFEFDATNIWGNKYPADSPRPENDMDPLYLRLLLGSHLARHLRHALEMEYNYTSSVGISTNKLLSKLVGNIDKPRGQTTLLPPYTSLSVHETSNVTRFLDSHDIGKIPGIGFKLGQKIRRHILGQPADFEKHAGSERSKENLSVHDVRTYPEMGPHMLERILGGPGTTRGIGGKVWALINGVDDSAVALAKRVPTQISIEDSYSRIDTLEQVKKELVILSRSLLKRMHIDLMGYDEETREVQPNDESPLGSINCQEEKRRRGWIAHPKTLRLSTRPRILDKPYGVKTQFSNRISRTVPLPNFAFSLVENIDSLAERLAKEALIPLFRRLHPDKFNLNLINVAVTNMVETAHGDNENRAGAERDIGKMFHRQEGVLRARKVEDRDIPPHHDRDQGLTQRLYENEEKHAKNAESWETQELGEVTGIDDSSAAKTVQFSNFEKVGSSGRCELCGTLMPDFAIQAHIRFHELEG